MERKTVKNYLMTAAVLVILGIFFRFVMQGYGFLGCGFFAAAVIALVLLFVSYLLNGNPVKEKKVRKIIYFIVFAFCIILAVTEVIIISDASTTASGEDYAVVLGAGVYGETPSRPLRWRINAAAEYLEKYPDTVCIASGGRGEGENISEAECIARELIALGIDESRIIKEENSYNTRQNIENSIAIMQSLSGDDYTAAIVTSDFHLCRAKTVAYKLGLRVSGVCAGTKLPVLCANYFFREAFGLWKTMLIDTY